MEEFFTNIYENKKWGDDNNNEYDGGSGTGSEINNTIEYIDFLKMFINKNDIKTVVDLGCGSFLNGSLIYDNIDITYIGYDTYKKIIDYNKKQHLEPKYTFMHLDFYTKKEDIIGGDLCILKDVLQHWHMDEIYIFLDYLIESKKFKYILLCNCCNQKLDNPDNSGRSTPLSARFFPLKKYNPIIIHNYYTKEISIIINRL